MYRLQVLLPQLCAALDVDDGALIWHIVVLAAEFTRLAEHQAIAPLVRVLPEHV
jgi:hypothetical protein